MRVLVIDQTLSIFGFRVQDCFTKDISKDKQKFIKKYSLPPMFRQFALYRLADRRSDRRRDCYNVADLCNPARKGEGQTRLWSGSRIIYQLFAIDENCCVPCSFGLFVQSINGNDTRQTSRQMCLQVGSFAIAAVRSSWSPH